MKAVILANGEGAGLHPLTLDTPKSLAKLCGRPVLGYVLALLERYHITDCLAVTAYRHESAARWILENTPRAMRVTTVQDGADLGRAGSVKNACYGCKEEILVIDGSVLCDVNLDEALACHRRAGAIACIVTKRVERPQEHTLVSVSDKGLVTGFLEKPSLAAAGSLGDTGIYILAPELLEEIPSGSRCDFVPGLFTRLINERRRVAAYESGGYCNFINSTGSFLQCQYDLLSGSVGNQTVQGQAPPLGSYSLKGDVYFGKNVRIGEGARIVGPCVLDENVAVGAAAVIVGGVLSENCVVGEGARLQEALLCPGAFIKSGARLWEGCAVGRGATVGADTELRPGVAVWPHRRVPGGVVICDNLITQNGNEGFFDDEGITGEIGAQLTPELFTRIGCAIGSAMGSKNIAVGCSENKAARALKAALGTGIQSTGAMVSDFGAVYRSLFDFCLTYTAGKLGIYIHCTADRGSLELVGEAALGCPRETERAIEKILAGGEFVRAGSGGYGERIDMEGMQVLYASELLRHAAFGLEGMAARVHSEQRAVEKLLTDTLAGLGCDTETGMLLKVDGAGKRLDIEDTQCGFLSHERILCLLAQAEFLSKGDVSVPFGTPRLIDDLAAAAGQSALRYTECPTTGANERARALAVRQCQFRDGLMMAIHLLSFLKISGMSLLALHESVPLFGAKTAQLSFADSPAALMERLTDLGAQRVEEGVILPSPLGIALIRPSKQGDRIRIFAESHAPECSAELCEEVLSRIRDIRDAGLDKSPKE